MKERLIEMIQSAVGGCAKYWAEVIADKLIAEGVIVPPCKVGDKMYFDGKYFARHCAGKIMERIVDVVLTEVWATFRGEVDVSFDFESFGKTVFLTREEAEEALERSENGKS